MDIASSTFDPLVRRLWMRAAGRVRVPAGQPPPFQASTVMDALHAVRVAHAHGYGGATLRVLVQGRPVVAPHRWLPARKATLEQYLAALQRRARGRRVALVLNNAQAHSWPLYREARALLGGLMDRVGVPAGPTEVGIFLGNYQAEDLGVHTDRVAVLMNVLHGHKTLKVWPLGRSPSRAAPRVFGVTPGQLLYWPAGVFHVGGCTSMTLSVNVALGTHGGTYSAPDVGVTAAEVLAHALRNRVETSGAPVFVVRSGAPPRAVKALAARQRRAWTSGALELAVDRWALGHASALGFGVLPADMVWPGGSSHVEGHRGEILLVRRRGVLLVAAHGRVAVVNNPTPRLLAVLDRLAAGAAVALAGTDAATLQLLRRLVRWGAATAHDG